eukprot:Opistho-2@20928
MRGKETEMCNCGVYKGSYTTQVVPSDLLSSCALSLTLGSFSEAVDDAVANSDFDDRRRDIMSSGLRLLVGAADGSLFDFSESVLARSFSFFINGATSCATYAYSGVAAKSASARCSSTVSVTGTPDDVRSASEGKRLGSVRYGSNCREWRTPIAAEREQGQCHMGEYGFSVTVQRLTQQLGRRVGKAHSTSWLIIMRI